MTQSTQQQQQPFYGPLWYRVSRYQKKHSPTHHPDHHPIFISFFHLPWSIASFLFKLRAWQSFCTTSVHVLFGLPVGLGPSTSYSIHFFTQPVSFFRNTCPYHRNLFCSRISIISSIPRVVNSNLLSCVIINLIIIVTFCKFLGVSDHTELPCQCVHSSRSQWTQICSDSCDWYGELAHTSGCGHDRHVRWSAQV